MKLSDVLTLPKLRSSNARAIDAESPHGSCKDIFEEKPPQTLYIGGATLVDMFIIPYSLSWVNESHFLGSLTIYRFREFKNTDPRLDQDQDDLCCQWYGKVKGRGVYTVIENIENFVQKVFLADIRFNYQAVLSVSEADLSG